MPVEQIIERCYDLRVEWVALPEGTGEMVLGALDPNQQTIFMNEAHAETVLARIGPLNFTFAHELGHWLYDAVPPEQQSLMPEASEVFCRGGEVQDDTTRIRETNANKFAAALLLPTDLVRREARPDLDRAAVRGLAARWGVSQAALRIRLSELGYVEQEDGLFSSWS